LLINKWLRKIYEYNDVCFTSTDYLTNRINEIDYTIFRPDLSITE